MAQGNVPPWLCVLNTVLGNNACARDFFIDSDAEPFTDPNTGEHDNGPDRAQYAIGGPLWDLAGIAYNPSFSGAQNMRAATVKQLAGDPTVTRFTPLVWP